MVDPYEPPKETVTPPKRRRRAVRQRPHNGVLILVLGILGFMFCPLLGIFSWIMGHGSLKEIREGRMDPSGRATEGVGSEPLLTLLLLLLLLEAGAGLGVREGVTTAAGVLRPVLLFRPPGGCTCDAK